MPARARPLLPPASGSRSSCFMNPVNNPPQNQKSLRYSTSHSGAVNRSNGESSSSLSAEPSVVDAICANMLSGIAAAVPEPASILPLGDSR